MPYLSTHLFGPGPSGPQVLSVLAKRTYSIGNGKVVEAESQVPIQLDTIFSDPGNVQYSAVVAESDMVAFKPSTDVVVTGSACAPRGKQALFLECEARIGPLYKMVRVFGDRKIVKKALSGASFTDPVPFSEMELSYTRAYGGVAVSKNGTYLPYYPNAIGKGYALKGGFDDITALAVPNQEDGSAPLMPESLIVDKPEDVSRAPQPASFGWTRQDFYPRFTYLCGGPLFVEGAAEKGKTFSAKIDPRFFQGASDGLWGKQLVGNEPVTLKYFDPDNPTFQFVLPGEKPGLTIDLGEGVKGLEPVLQTVVIDMKEKILTMLWRGSIAMEPAAAIEGLMVGVE